MALDTTPGSASADSYASLGEAATRLANFSRPEWAAAADPAREGALRRATAWIDGHYRSRFTGTRTNGRSQSLEWPRTGAIDTGGVTIENDEIPIEIVNATIEAAYLEITQTGILAPVPSEAASGTIKRKRETVGPITEETEYVEGSSSVSHRPEFSSIDNILSGLIAVKSSFATGWLLRA